jgi:hypothetical protein
MPNFDTFRDLDLFLRLWNSGLEWLKREGHAEDVKEYARLWSLAGWVVVNECYGAFARQGAKTFVLAEEVGFKGSHPSTESALAWQTRCEKFFEETGGAHPSAVSEASSS